MLSQLGLQEEERRKLFPFRKRKGRSEAGGSRGREERRKEREGRRKRQKEQSRVQKTVLEQMLPTRPSLLLYPPLSYSEHLVLFKCRLPH